LLVAGYSIRQKAVPLGVVCNGKKTTVQQETNVLKQKKMLKKGH